MTVDFAVSLAYEAISGSTLKKSALKEVLETLVAEIEKPTSPEKTCETCGSVTGMDPDAPCWSCTDYSKWTPKKETR